MFIEEEGGTIQQITPTDSEPTTGPEENLLKVNANGLIIGRCKISQAFLNWKYFSLKTDTRHNFSQILFVEYWKLHFSGLISD